MVEDYQYQPKTIYGASKLTGEYYTKVFHRSGWLQTVIARPHNTYGPRSHCIGISEELIPKLTLAALAGEQLEIYGDGKQTRDFTFVLETARFISDLAQNENCLGETFNVCKGEEVSVKRIVDLVLKLTESSSSIKNLPPRQNDVLRLWGDNSKLRRFLGSAPSTPIEEGLRATINWFRGQPRLDRNSDLRSRDPGVWPYEDWIPRSELLPV
jgi:UDP-glucose 4-epimerase